MNIGNTTYKNRVVTQILKEISETAQLMTERGWAEKNAGNISVNISNYIQSNYNAKSELRLNKSYPTLASMLFYITASGSRMRDVAKNPLQHGLIIQLNKQGDAYSIISDQKNLKPTSEFASHLNIHQLFKERKSNETVVLHTHATELIVLTQCKAFKTANAINKIIWNMHPETLMFVPKGVGFVPYMLAGGQAIAEATIKSLQNHDIVLWEKHGVFAIGESILDTFDSIDIICKSAKIWQMCQAAGFVPEGFTTEQISEIKRFNSQSDIS